MNGASISSGLLLLLVVGGAIPARCAVGGGIPCTTTASCTTRGSTTAEAYSFQSRNELVQHERPSFALSWVSRARGGGGARVTADGGSKREKGDGGGGAGRAGQDEVEVALVGNFPNRQV